MVGEAGKINGVEGIGRDAVDRLARVGGALVDVVRGASVLGASAVGGGVASMGPDILDEGVGIETSGVGRSWTRGLGVAEETYIAAGALLGLGLGSGTGLEWDFCAFFCTGLAGDLDLGTAFFFFGSVAGLGAASSSLEAALRFWDFGSTSITTSALTFALAGEAGGVDFRGLLLRLYVFTVHPPSSSWAAGTGAGGVGAEAGAGAGVLTGAGAGAVLAAGAVGDVGLVAEA